jgi:hypothetical protein
MDLKEKSWFFLFDRVFEVDYNLALDFPLYDADLPRFFDKIKNQDIGKFNKIIEKIGV